MEFNAPTPNPDAPSPPSAPELALREQFEDAWQHGSPALIDFLPALRQGQEESHRRVLLQLLPIDLEYQWRRSMNDRPLLEDYVQRFPELGPVVLLPTWPREFAPQQSTVPVTVKAHAWLKPAVMPTMLDRPGTASGVGENGSPAPRSRRPCRRE